MRVRRALAFEFSGAASFAVRRTPADQRHADVNAVRAVWRSSYDEESEAGGGGVGVGLYVGVQTVLRVAGAFGTSFFGFFFSRPCLSRFPMALSFIWRKCSARFEPARGRLLFVQRASPSVNAPDPRR
jgi:hypothetical protein